MEQKFYKCAHCGKIIAVVKETGVPVMCCGQKMDELVPNTTDAAQEKHVPVVTREGNTITVTVGSVEHPMLPEHYIQWIVLETENGFRIAELKPGDKPQVKFFENEKVIAVYEYCNLHGLWKTEA